MRAAPGSGSWAPWRPPLPPQLHAQARHAKHAPRLLVAAQQEDRMSSAAKEAVDRLRGAAREAAQAAYRQPQLDSSFGEARRLLDALEAELRAADEEAAAAGTDPNDSIPLSEPPPELRRAQAAASPPAQIPQQQQQQQLDRQPDQAHQAMPAQQVAEPEPEPIVGQHRSGWAPPPAPQPDELPMPPGNVRAEGSGHEVLLQAFNWESANSSNWWEEVERAAPEIAKAGFSVAWLPPPTQSVSRQGYMPTDLYNLNSAYGSADSLKKCVKSLQGAGLKVLADIVINHRCAAAQDEQGVWNVFGGKLAWNADAIVGDHFEFRGRGNESSGDPFPAAPNLDHSADFVKSDLSDWLRWMRSEYSFDGWRFDFARGYSGDHVADYCEATAPEFAVAEFWDSLAYRRGVALRNQDAHRGRLVAWMKAAGGSATAFDMTTKGIMHQAFERGDLSRLRDSEGKPPGLIGWWPSHATTFLENHDTGSTQGHWRFPAERVEAGHAYIMTHPGTPCIFWDHWRDARLRPIIERLIRLRREQGLHCRSAVTIHEAAKELYVAEIDGKVLVKIGAKAYEPEDAAWQPADKGKAWELWLR